MLISPVRKADIAKLMLASTTDMVTTFDFFNKHLTLGASFPTLKVFLKVFVTRSNVPFEHALRTKLSVAERTGVFMISLD